MVAIPEEVDVKELTSTLKDVEIEDVEIEEISTGKDTEMKEETTLLTAVKNQNQNLLSHFWNLASLEETKRTESVVALLNELKKSGKQDDLNYTAQRLVKGLSSSRKAARQGFATALTHVMKEFNEITTDKILELMANHLAVQGNFKGQEERDTYLGQVFGILAIMKAKFKDDTSTMDMNLVKKIAESLLILIKKKSYLQETCGIAICDILKYIDYTAYQSIQPLLEPILKRGWEKCSPEDLMIVLTVQSKFKNELPKKCFKEHWNRSEILHKSNFKHLSRVLMDTTNTAHPRVHLLWDMILEHFLSSEMVNDDEKFNSFWKAIVEEGLMQSTHERKFLVMNLILKVLPKLPSDKVEIVLRECITRCMINSCQSKLNYLYNAVRNMLSKLPAAVADNEDNITISNVIKCLVGRHGHVCFDSITKTKTVEELAQKISHNLPDYFNWLKDVFNAGTTNLDLEETKEMSEKDVNECRSWVANQLIILLRIGKNQNAESLLLEIADFIFFHSYFTAVKKSKKEAILHEIPSHPVSDVTHQVCRQRFNTALTELANIFKTKSEGDKQTIGGIAEDGEYYAWKNLTFGKKLLEMPKYVQLSTPWTPEIYESWNHSLERISKMQEEDSKDESTVNSKGTELLFIHATLQLFSNREEAVDVLKELETCYQKAQETKRRKKTEPHWTEVLTEILLGFLAQSSHLMRQVVDLVYPTILPHLTQDALDLLVKAIKPQKKNEDSTEFANDSDLEDIDEEETNKDGENEGDDQDENKEQDNEEENDKEMNSDSEDDDDDSDDDHDDDDMEVNEEFRAELKAALGDSAANSENEDTDENEDESEDSDIDMDTCDPKTLKAMDQALASVFKAREQKKIEKKKKKDRKLGILHFKLRVLDLIEIFIKKQPKDIKILQLLEPLYEVIKASHGQSDEQPLFERTLGIFKNKLCNLHEYPSGKDLDVDDVHDQIEHLIELAKTASSALLVTYITQGTIYLIRVLRGNPELKAISPLRTRSHSKRNIQVQVEPDTSHVGCLNEIRLIKCYKAALTDFMTKRNSHLQPVLFNELIQRFPSLGWKLAVDIPQYLNIGCNNFRKVKACEMIKLLLSKKTDTFEECLAEIQESMNTNIIKAFQATKEENYSLKARQFHDIIHIADIYFKELFKHPKIADEVDLTGIKSSVTEALESPVVTRSTSLQSYCQTFLLTLNNTNNEDKPAKKKKK